MRRYSRAERERAIELYDKCHNVKRVAAELNISRPRVIYSWLYNRYKEPRRTSMHIPEYKVHPDNPKLKALYRCFEMGEPVILVAEEMNISRSKIYRWRISYLRRGYTSLMSKQEKKPANQSEMEKEIADLRKQLAEVQFQLDVMNETFKVLKKDQGVNPKTLTNQEKTAVIDALKDKYKLSCLLKMFQLKKSSYFYQESIKNRTDSYSELRKKIGVLFKENHERYGYRRIHTLLKRDGIIVSEKIVRRLMSEEKLIVKNKRRRKYNSYLGEITPAVPNLLNRNFHASAPNEKWLTDITEFAIENKKVYLSPVIDCFDGMVVTWAIGTRPDSELVNTMLEKAITTLKHGEKPIVHSDRGNHYRWPGWIHLMEDNGLVRSMSKKGCSPDNSACEGFFGRLKNEMFYNRNWNKTTLAEFIKTLDDYIVWYNKERIKNTLGGMSPIEYRQSLGLQV